jgi:hypothetical protein
MQYTSKIALLAVALFGTSALAAPFAGEAEYDVEAREVDNDLSAREFYDMYLEARADPSLDARDLESMDFEAREYLDYLEAREAATATPMTPQTPQTPLSPKSSRLETQEHSRVATHSESKHELVHLSQHQKSVRRAKKVAAKKFKDVEFYHHALLDKENQFHKFAVLKYLNKPKNLKKALANTNSPYHKAAKRVLHRHKAKVYLADKKNFKKALTHKRSRYHKDAVKMYLSQGDHYEFALTHKRARYHKAAVHEYLLDTNTRKQVLSDKTNAFYKQAVKLQKKINKRHEHIKLSDGSHSGNSTTAAHKA